MKSFIYGAVVPLVLFRTNAVAELTDFPQVLAIAQDSVQVSADGRAVKLAPGERSGRWSLMAVVGGAAGNPAAVFEDFSSMRGSMVLVDTKGERQELTKLLEATFADPKTLYRGHTFKEVVASEHDLLGAEILAELGDPSFAAVASCLAPITKIETYTVCRHAGEFGQGRRGIRRADGEF
jgi:hypothetical protein